MAERTSRTLRVAGWRDDCQHIEADIQQHQCGHIDDGISFSFIGNGAKDRARGKADLLERDEGSWVVDFSDLERIYLAATAYRKAWEAAKATFFKPEMASIG